MLLSRSFCQALCFKYVASPFSCGKLDLNALKVCIYLQQGMLKEFVKRALISRKNLPFCRIESN